MYPQKRIARYKLTSGKKKHWPKQDLLYIYKEHMFKNRLKYVKQI